MGRFGFHRARLLWSFIVLSLLGPVVATFGQCYQVESIVEGPPCGGQNRYELYPKDINLAGHACGMTACGGAGWGVSRAFVWRGTGSIEIIPMPAGTFESTAYAINNRGWVAGVVRRTYPGSEQGLTAGFLYRDGQLITIWPTTLDDYRKIMINDMNDEGVIVGMEHETEPPVTQMRAFSWKEGVFTWLSDSLEGPSSEAMGINAEGTIVGWSGMGGLDCHPFVVRSGRADEWPADPVAKTFRFDRVTDNGFILAQRYTDTWPDPYPRDVAVIGPSGRMTIMPRFNEARNDYRPRSISPDGSTVIGNSAVWPNDDWETFIWRGGHPEYLEDLTEPTIIKPSIFSYVTGDGRLLIPCANGTFSERIHILSPAPPEPGDLSGNCLIGFTDLVMLLGRWGTVDEEADLDESGIVDAGDILYILEAWEWSVGP